MNKQLPGLLDSEPIACYPALAVRAGINQALMLQQLHFLIKITEKTNSDGHYFAGRWWVYNTYATWKRDYFPWLSESTIKRLFLELEREGIVMSWMPVPGQEVLYPGMPPVNPKIDEGTKYYTIRYEHWDRWFKVGQKETPPVSKRDAPRINLGRPPSQKETPPVSKKDEVPIYIDSQRIPEITSETTTENESPTTTGSGESGPGDPTAANETAVDVVVEKDSSNWILPEIRKLHLTPDVQQELLALGVPQALATAWAAQGPGARSPGGLAVSIMRGAGPPDDMLELAKVAVEMHTLDREAASQALNRRQLEVLNDQAQELVAARESPEPPPESPAISPQEASEPDGLDDKPPGSNLSWRDIWRGVLGQLSIQLNRSTYVNWVEGTKVVSYADGALTIQARHVMSKGWIDDNRRAIEDTLRGLAKQAVRIEVVVAPPLNIHALPPVVSHAKV